jgi:hypothetical protein
MALRGRPSKKTYTQIGNYRFDVEFFQSKLKAQPTGCLEWTGATHRQGYGMCGGFRVHDNKKIMTVTHRIAMMIELDRDLASTEFVVHECTNLLCCNPAHMILGGTAERSQIMRRNMDIQRQKITAGTATDDKYQRHAKYTADEVRWIRTANSLDIADRYNLTRLSASNLRAYLKKNYTWVV